jgi:formamidopyrimidine-DNA glycosylase
MPELPDVEVFKSYLDATALHRKIENVAVPGTEMLEHLSAADLETALKGHTFRSTRRHGKYLFVQLDTGRWLVLHFGMSGFLKYFKNDEKKTAHERLRLRFDNGYHLVYDCQRKLGLIALTDDVEDYIAHKDLGPDPWASQFDYEEFRSVLTSSKAAVKSALMNQKLMAGIGNIYSDEILFQAGVHPEVRANALDNNQLQALYREMMQTVLPKSVDARAQPEDFPSSFLIPRRNKGGRCPRCGAEIRHAKVSGRTAYFCPKCQKKKG